MRNLQLFEQKRKLTFNLDSNRLELATMMTELSKAELHLS